jgi:hypothetical protein
MKIVVSFSITKDDGRPFISGENDLSEFDEDRIRSEIAALGIEVAKYVALGKLEFHGSLSDDSGPRDFDPQDILE